MIEHLTPGRVISALIVVVILVSGIMATISMVTKENLIGIDSEYWTFWGTVFWVCVAIAGAMIWVR